MLCCKKKEFNMWYSINEDEMVGWHTDSMNMNLGRLWGDGKAQRNLVCCSPWNHKESGMTWWLTTATVLLTKVKILFKYHKTYANVHYFFAYLIQDSTLYLLMLNSFICMQQILINSPFTSFCYKYFLNFLVMTS